MGFLRYSTGHAKRSDARAQSGPRCRKSDCKFGSGFPGKCEFFADKVVGIAVHIGARVIGKAEPGEVIVSATVKDLVAGAGHEFSDRGAHELRGIPGEWRLFAVR